MDGLLERTSPRRGSLNSLHRQSSNSLPSANNPKFATLSQHSQTNNNGTATTNNNNNLSSSSNPTSPDIDKYTRYFIIKAVQIIVQSRVGGNKELRSECKPNGNDWFNINLTDNPEISELTKAAIDPDGVSIKSNWKVCCEISLKTGDGTRVILEQWLITNKTISIAALPNSTVGSPNTINSNNIATKSPNNNISADIINNTSTISNSNSNLSTQQQQASSNNAPCSIYTIYNRMTLLLKTLMTTAHIVPAFRLASKVTRPSVICYKVNIVTSSSSCQNLSAPGSPMKGDITTNGLKNRSVNHKATGLTADDLDNHFGPLMKLGSIKTDTNELSISYRTDTNSSDHLLGSPKSRNSRHNDWGQGRIGGAIQDQDYLIAAKQLLAGNGNRMSLDQRRNSTENLDSLDQPLMPAFATRIASAQPDTERTASLVKTSETTSKDNNQNDLYGELIESAFDSLLKRNSNGDSDMSHSIAEAATTTLAGAKHLNGFERSANIQVPKANSRNRSRGGPKSQQLCTDHSSGSTPKSLSDSYVFVDINPPFASGEQNDINSFFHGPSPSFSGGFDGLKDVDELTNQLATIEANASQIDDFVDNICASEGEEEEYER